MSRLSTAQLASPACTCSWTNTSADRKGHSEFARSFETTFSPPTTRTASAHLSSPASVSTSTKSSTRRPEVCVARLDPYVCRVHFTIYRKRIYADLERYIAGLAKQTPPGGMGIRARDAFHDLPIFDHISREDLCERCALRELEKIMYAPGGWYRKVQKQERQESVWLAEASRVPLPPGDIFTGSSTSTGSKNHEPQGVKLTDDDCIIRIDWADPSVTRTIPSMWNTLSARGLGEAEESNESPSVRRRVRSRRKLRNCFAG